MDRGMLKPKKLGKPGSSKSENQRKTKRGGEGRFQVCLWLASCSLAWLRLPLMFSGLLSCTGDLLPTIKTSPERSITLPLFSNLTEGRKQSVGKGSWWIKAGRRKTKSAVPLHPASNWHSSWERGGSCDLEPG